jgi:hypothetical protein
MSAHIPRYAANAFLAALDEGVLGEEVDVDVSRVVEPLGFLTDESPTECEPPPQADNVNGTLATATHATARSPR